nr:diguanylate cyclase [Nocardia bovistercoris]
MNTDPFDAAVGLQVGAALVTAGLPEAAPISSVLPLRKLAAVSLVDDAERRASVLLASVVRGYREKSARAVSSVPIDPSEPRAITEEAFRAALDSAAVGVVIGDLDGTVRYTNPAMAAQMGVPLEALRTLSVFDYTHPDDVDEANAQFLDQMGRGSSTARVESRMIRPDGEVRWSSVVVTLVPGPGGHPDTFVAVAEDVTERRRLQEELHWQARHDALTGLSNRRGLLEQIDAIVTAATSDDRIGLCFADLDQFKLVNDQYGHTIGDSVLAAVAHRLQSAVAEYDYTVTRIGGDEFVVLIPPPADDTRVVAVADALLASLTTPIAVGEYDVRMSVSIGAVVAEVSDQEATALLDAADRALYRAKSDGRHRWVLHDGTDTETG